MKKIINMGWLITLILIVGGYLSSVEAISIVPSIVKLSLTQGESKSNVFEINNGGNEEVYVEIFTKDWILENNSRKFAPAGTHSRSLSKWITFEEESFTLAPKQKRSLRYAIDVPQNAEGGYWGLVCFNSRPLKKGGGVRVATQLVSFVGAEITGTLKKKIEIIEISAENIKDRGFRFQAKLKNLGNSPLFQPSPVGKFKIKDKNDNVIAEGNLEGTMILPNEIGDYTSEYFKLNTPDENKYLTTIIFDYGDTKLIGKKVILPTNTFYNWQVLEKPATKEATETSDKKQ
ncbi:MAG: hypothetical protein AB1414_14400 [bacterium]